MKNSYLFLCIVIFTVSGTNVSAQLGWDWAYAEECDLESQGNDVLTDSLGNIYVCGYFGAQTQFGDKEYESITNHDYFVAKLNPERETLWFRHGGAGIIDAYNFANGMVLDDSLNLYVNHSVSTEGATIIQKYDPAGELVWEDFVSAGYHWEHKGRMISMAEDKIIVGGSNGIKSFDSEGTMLNSGSWDFTALSNFENGKFAGAGEQKLVMMDAELTTLNSFSLPSSIELTNALVLHDSAIYLTGRFTGPVVWGDSTFTGDHDMYIAKMDENGTLLWFNQCTGPAYKTGNALVINEQGMLFVAGAFSSEATFDTIALGQVGMAKQVFTAEYDINTGSLKDVIQAGSLGDQEGAFGMCESSDGQLLVTGSIRGSYSGASFGDIIVHAETGNIDFFLAKTMTPEVKSEIKGRVTKGGEPEACRIKLFRIDEEEGATKVYDMASDPEGEFKIGVYKKGEYLLKAHYYNNGHVGTYFEKAFMWDQSSKLLVDSDTIIDSLIIDLMALQELEGQNVISGTVYNSEEMPERFIDMILVNDENSPVGYVCSDTLGEYRFTGIPDGTYKVMVDTAGLIMNSCHTISIPGFKSTLAEYSDYDYILRDGMIYKSGSTAISLKESIKPLAIRVFPVPARDLLQIEYTFADDHNSSIEILDMNGRLLRSLPRGQWQVDVSGFPDGTYILKVIINNALYTSKFQVISGTL